MPPHAIVEALDVVEHICPGCQGTMRIIAVITHAAVIDQILTHLRTRTIAPGVRGPPSTRAPATATTPRPSRVPPRPLTRAPGTLAHRSGTCRVPAGPASNPRQRTTTRREADRTTQNTSRDAEDHAWTAHGGWHSGPHRAILSRH